MNHPLEYKVVALRECPVKSSICVNPRDAVNFWRKHVETDPRFNPEVECAVCVALNTRLKVKGFWLVGIGTVDSVTVHAREVFRPAIVTSAKCVILIHNHPSGSTIPSESDIDVTKQLVQAGWLLQIEFMDSVIVGRRSHCSLKARNPEIFRN